MIQEMEKLSAEEAKRRMTILSARLGPAQAALEKAEKTVKDIEREIRDVQDGCPHPETTSRLVIDVAVMKDRNFCTTCGVQV